MIAINELWDEVSLAVCRICVDHTHEGCSLVDLERCALKAHFEEVVGAVASVNDEQFAPYVWALRERVCAVCKHQMAEGRCAVRDHVDCALDRYYALVIEAIESSIRPPA